MAAGQALEALAVDCRWFHKFRVVEVEVKKEKKEGEGQEARKEEKAEKKMVLRGYCTLGVHRALGRMVDNEYCSKCGLRVGLNERRPSQWAIETARRLIMRGVIPSSWEELE